jgi:6-phosphogluconate dehydrogenase
MRIGIIGLGKMGGNMALRLLNSGHEIVAFDHNKEAVSLLASKGATPAIDLAQLVSSLAPRKVIWMMVPSGKPVSDTIEELTPMLGKGDILIDGGNSYYKDSARRYEELKAKGICFVDAGTSGGIWGLTEGYCIMAGGDKEAFDYIEPAVRSLAQEGGYLYTGPAGSGHYVKMIHNGIEYGMMEAYAEGFELMKQSDYRLDLENIAGLWMHGSVVRSWLLELLGSALA